MFVWLVSRLCVCMNEYECICPKKNIIIIIINSKNNIKMIMITFNKNIYKKEAKILKVSK